MSDIHGLVEAQRAFFETGKTLGIPFRMDALRSLRSLLQNHQTEISEALRSDLGKSDTESYMCETGMVLSEIGYLLRHMRRWSRPRRVLTPMAQFHARSFTLSSPLGCALIMSPWNYPLLLTLEPLADALAAGCTAILKPSAYSPATSGLIARLIGEAFPAEYVAVVTGGREENASLLDERFDKIFFTGSKAVGRIVLEKAAPHLTPVTLELGGKSPCIVDATANLSIAARRIVFGKYLNLGQTCVAPDYVLVEESVHDALLSALKEEVVRQFGADALQNPDYGRMINRRHFDRVLGLIDPEKAVFGGICSRETLQIAPTILDRVSGQDAVMQEEIFGPVLPILTVRDIDEAIAFVNAREKPLALYVFTSDRRRARRVLSECTFGGGCVNDTIIHLATSRMRFGGVGESGMGGYHGKAGFDAFSTEKNIVDKKTWIDLSMRYQPYRPGTASLIRKFLH